MAISPVTSNGIKFGSNSEKKIYELAYSSGYFNTTFRHLYYSLHLSQTGNKKLTGEIDFLYLDEKFMLFLEVKGGEVKYDSLNNQWWVMGGTKAQDPFYQALGSLFQVRDILLPGLFKSKSISNRLIFGYGVLFPESIKPSVFPSSNDTIEYSMDIVFDFNDINCKNNLVNYIQKLKKYWSERDKYKSGTYGIGSKELSTISTYFRHDLHFRLPAVEILKSQSAEIDRLTSVQMFALANLDLNPGKGGIVSGGPGTGKTLLALELLKKKVEEKKKVLFLCYNKNLANVLNDRFYGFSFGTNYKLVHIHGLYEEICPADLIHLNIKNKDFWHRILPLKVKDVLTSFRFEKFDYIIIDEAQDLLNEYHFDVINELLIGGFNSGNWAMFLDHDFQNIYNPYAVEYFEFFKNIYPCFTNKLFLNCRNTKSIVRLAAKHTGFEEMPCFRELDSFKSQIKKYASTDKDLINILNQTISTKISEDKINPRQITVLCFTKEQKEYILNANSKISDYTTENSDCIKISTIHGFKGLENDFILIVGPDKFNGSDKIQMSLLCVAYTRATVQALFFTKEINQHAIEFMLM